NQLNSKNALVCQNSNARHITSSPPAIASGRRKTRANINIGASILMLFFTALLAVVISFYWPDTSGPAPGKPTIAAFLFSVDRPNIDGGVRILINPDTDIHTGGPPRLVVWVDLNVPPGETVRWALELGAVSNEISLKKSSLPASSHSGDLIKAPVSYQMPPPLNGVRDYLLVGQVRGPSS